MANRATEMRALAKRAEAAGWPVEKLPSGILRVKCDDGHRVQLHLTPSDGNGPKHALQELMFHGLARAEEVAAKKAEQARLATLVRVHEGNDRLIELKRQQAQEAAERAALHRAQGPYAPSDVTIEEILREHPAPITWSNVLVTPEMATAILERHHKNRKISPARLIEREQSLRADDWRLTHQGIALDWDGYLQDGRHRLTAIENTGISARMMVSAGMDPENFAYIDRNMPRTGGQTFDIMGVRSSAAVATMVRLIVVTERWGELALDHANEKVTNDILVRHLGFLNLQMIYDRYNQACRLRNEIGTSPTGTAAGFILIDMAGDSDKHKETLNAFIEKLIRGVDPDTEKLVFALRRRLTRNASRAAGGSSQKKIIGIDMAALLIAAWNQYVTGVEPDYIRIPTKMPSVLFIP